MHLLDNIIGISSNIRAETRRLSIDIAEASRDEEQRKMASRYGSRPNPSRMGFGGRAGLGGDEEEDLDAESSRDFYGCLLYTSPSPRD